jgi:hypothetical protein
MNALPILIAPQFEDNTCLIVTDRDHGAILAVANTPTAENVKELIRTGQKSLVLVPRVVTRALVTQVMRSVYDKAGVPAHEFCEDQQKIITGGW